MYNKINISNVKEECCGCLNCQYICPVSAVKLTIGGYFYPEVTECIECGLCKKICPVINNTSEERNDVQESYISFISDVELRKKSTSGGIFYAVASNIIAKKGVVYGAIYGEKMKVCHFRADKIEQINYFRGSKYVQSDISKVLPLIIKDLNNGKIVLFSGTPCQVAAVKCLCKGKSNYENLITLEILCYGVPSPLIFDDHIQLIEKLYKSKVISYTFRDEREGWSQYYIHSAKFSNGVDIYNNNLLQGLEQLYRSHYNVRESCFECKFIGNKRCGDITVGDCWGINEIAPDMNADYGISLVLVNSNKGVEIWNELDSELEYRKVDLNTLKKFNGVLVSAPQKPDDYEEFWRYYKKNGYLKTLKCYSPYGGVYFKIMRKIRGIKRHIKRKC